MAEEFVDRYFTDTVDAGREYLGSPALNHKAIVGGMCGSVDETLAVCMEFGLGPDSFDCSGFVAASICMALGKDVSEWPAELRHCRQMNQELLGAGTPRMGLDEAVAQKAYGLMFSYRQWTNQETSLFQWRVGHVSILTGISDEQVPITIQAQAGLERAVVERPIITSPDTDLSGVPDRFVVPIRALAHLAFPTEVFSTLDV